MDENDILDEILDFDKVDMDEDGNFIFISPEVGFVKQEENK